MDDEVILPSFDIEQDKPLAVVTEENEQQKSERLIKLEVQDPKFPMLRAHWEGIAEQYGDISVLAGLPSEDFEVVVKTKAAIVSEIRDLLGVIDQISQVDGDGK